MRAGSAKAGDKRLVDVRVEWWVTTGLAATEGASWILLYLYLWDAIV